MEAYFSLIFSIIFLSFLFSIFYLILDISKTDSNIYKKENNKECYTNTIYIRKNNKWIEYNIFC